MKNNIISQREQLHPATSIALAYLSSLSPKKLDKWKRLFKGKYASNYTAKRCADTLDKLFGTEDIKEADVLALAWIMRFNIYSKKKDDE